MTENSTILQDGRRFAYAKYGDLDGTPIFYFHGGGAGSRLLARPLALVATELSYRIIAPDRPGIGLSDFQPGRTVLDWPADLGELADAMGIRQFVVCSESGGGPYVAACALKIPERLTAAAIVAGICPLDIPGVTREMSKQNRTVVWLVQKTPFWFLRMMFGLQGKMLRKRPEKFLAEMMKGLPDVDRKALEEHDDFRDMMMKGLCEAFRQGSLGPAWDVKLAMQNWGFRLQEIPMEIQIWHGEADKNAPVAMARTLEHLLPKSRATYYRDEGHISLLHNHAREILTALRKNRLSNA